MVRTLLAAAILIGTSTLAHAQATSAPLVVSVVVVRTCTVDVPRVVDRSELSTMPVEIECVRRGNAARDGNARVQRLAPHRSVAHALVVIQF
jgi:hypothetical protein